MYIGLSYEVCLVDIRLRQLFDIFVIFSVFDFDYLWRTSCWCRLYNSWHGAPLGHYFEVLFIVLILVVVVLFVYLFFNLWKTSFIYNCDVFLVALRCPCFWLSSLDFIQFPTKNQLSLQIYMYIYIFFLRLLLSFSHGKHSLVKWQKVISSRYACHDVSKLYTLLIYNNIFSPA